jgi:hypothetical protein
MLTAAVAAALALLAIAEAVWHRSCNPARSAGAREATAHGGVMLPRAFSLACRCVGG